MDTISIRCGGLALALRIGRIVLGLVGLAVGQESVPWFDSSHCCWCGLYRISATDSSQTQSISSLLVLHL